MSSGVSSDLFGEVGRSAAVRYERTLRQYAETIWPGKDPASGARALKRWVAKGKKTGDMPPLDHLPELAAWYERHHRYAAAPEELRRFEIKGDEVESESDPSRAPDDDDAGDDERLPSMTLDLDGDFTADEGLRQIRALANATYAQMQIALKQRQTTLYRSLLREWTAMNNTRRQWEKDILKIQEGKGEVLRTRVINSELVRLFTTSGQSFFNALLKVLQDHAPHLPPEEQRRIALEKRDQVFTHLRGTRFESAWTPDSH